jgi:hypothetical protein
MPFTFSHPAIVLPLAYLPSRWFSMTGLIIGSVVPDFEYFIRMRLRSDYSHTVGGLFWFDLPLGLLLAFIFHVMVKIRLFDNLPSFLQSRFSTFRAFDWHTYCVQNWLFVVISILIGAASHIAWDGFTHKNGYFVQVFPALSHSVGILDSQVPILKILQHASTLIGGLVIAYAIYQLPTSPIKPSSISLKFWAIVLGLALTILFIRMVGGLDLKQYGNVIVTAISAGLIALTLTSWLANPKRAK